MKKILILLPDGVGIRNFATAHFRQLAASENLEIVWWKGIKSKLEVTERQIDLPDSSTHWKMGLLKNARKTIELNSFIRKFGDDVYKHYNFPLSFSGLQRSVKSYLTKLLITIYDRPKGLQKICGHIEKLARKGDYYQNCIETLRQENPDLVFCTNQRHVTAIAPLLAARDLGIPTSTFIFSWDNLPKATMVVPVDYYMVWSDLMKDEMQKYYPEIPREKVFVVGTPQFEPHFQDELRVSREVFCKHHGMDPQKQYVCFSGDDITTSPDDPQYLRDLAQTVSELNASGRNVGIIFRCCPIDFSDRYDNVLDKYSEIIIPIRPHWKREGDNWQSILPAISDNALLANTVAHSIGVFNIGSSMVFDFASQGKPCAYFNYNRPGPANSGSDIHTLYTYMHFRSMPSKESVIWVDSPNHMAGGIIRMLDNPEPTVKFAKEWFEKITKMPADSASERIIKVMKQIMTQA